MSNYDERVNDEADEHSQMMQGQRKENKGSLRFEWRKTEVCFFDNHNEKSEEE